eukprot:CAMPEP_0204822766 /NCGR_PEP_ID=MMETSP1346-20131115/949_1 /ASSEMBLY_ACC=CAM_ASM_000771 /TAXON_ID=215587 /ORGANISM="Aplanochytrium stocchinoi, Strain GSBS06" /LENGTH=634 /DNA_ID=CAMNT_0051949149 /DNA_START=328 /DNA_END=2232 /DNA_ORIENTATION=+
MLSFYDAPKPKYDRWINHLNNPKSEDKWIRNEKGNQKSIDPIELKLAGINGPLLVYRVVDKEGANVYEQPVRDTKVRAARSFRSYAMDDIVVGIDSSRNKNKRVKNWLKIGVQEWIPISRTRESEGDRELVLRFIKELEVPEKVNSYLNAPHRQCESHNSILESDDQAGVCRDENNIRAEVLRIVDCMKRGLNIDTGHADEVVTRTPSYVTSVTRSNQTSLGNVFSEVERLERLEICNSAKSWGQCTKNGFCAWKRLPNMEFCFVDDDYALPDMTLEEYNPAFDYRFDPDDTRKYFVYQPSGGMNNQRKQFENALIICMLLKRTCVAPPIAAHSNYFHNYNKQVGRTLANAQRIFDFPEILKEVDVVSIPPGVSFMDWIEEHKTDGTWYKVNRDYKKFKVVPKWGERYFKSKLATIKSKFIYFANHSMWGTLQWKGTRAGYYEKKIVQEVVMYNNVLKRTAQKLSLELGENGAYHSMHVRRGDKKTEASFASVSHDNQWYVERLLPWRNESKYLYIATDEHDRSYFSDFNETTFHRYFWEDLNQDILLPFLKRYPNRMFMDVLSIIEQLLCTYSIKFLGSGYSTLSVYILRMRKHRHVLGYDTKLGPVKGLPYNSRIRNSTCSPILALHLDEAC